MAPLRPLLAILIASASLAAVESPARPGSPALAGTPAALSPAPATAALPAGSRLGPSPGDLQQAHHALDQIFQFHTEAAVQIAREFQRRMPDHPLGYLLEAEADWWGIYCQSMSIRYNLIDAWSRPKRKEDDAYFALASRAIQLAGAQLARQESAPMHLFAGMGYGLEARLDGLRGEHLAVARAGVKGRENFLRALALDPPMGDALTGAGLYNYFADALSAFAKMLRFFMGIPGGNKKEGIRQLETAMNTAELIAVEARFYLARNLRNFEQQYERGAAFVEPLVARYPGNPVFQLLLGDMYAKLNRKDPAAARFRAAQQLPITDAVCRSRVESVASASLSALGR